jgi:hypothetical protein
MGNNSKLKGMVKLLAGVFFNKKGEQITSLREAQREEALSGCGIDCSASELVLQDKTSTVSTKLYFEGGNLIVQIGSNKFSATLTAV